MNFLTKEDLPKGYSITIVQHPESKLFTGSLFILTTDIENPKVEITCASCKGVLVKTQEEIIHYLVLNAQTDRFELMNKIQLYIEDRLVDTIEFTPEGDNQLELAKSLRVEVYINSFVRIIVTPSTEGLSPIQLTSLDTKKYKKILEAFPQIKKVINETINRMTVLEVHNP